MAKKATVTPIKSPLQKAMAKVLMNLNLNTVLLAVITGYFGIKNSQMTDKQDESLKKQ